MADNPNPPSHNKLGEMLLETTEGHELFMAAAIVIVIDTIGWLEAGSILGQDPGVGSRL